MQFVARKIPIEMKTCRSFAQLVFQSEMSKADFWLMSSDRWSNVLNNNFGHSSLNFIENSNVVDSTIKVKSGQIWELMEIYAVRIFVVALINHVAVFQRKTQIYFLIRW